MVQTAYNIPTDTKVLTTGSITPPAAVLNVRNKFGFQNFRVEEFVKLEIESTPSPIKERKNRVSLLSFYRIALRE